MHLAPEEEICLPNRVMLDVVFEDDELGLVLRRSWTRWCAMKQFSFTTNRDLPLAAIAFIHEDLLSSLGAYQPQMLDGKILLLQWFSRIRCNDYVYPQNIFSMFYRHAERIFCALRQKNTKSLVRVWGPCSRFFWACADMYQFSKSRIDLPMLDILLLSCWKRKRQRPSRLR